MAKWTTEMRRARRQERRQKGSCMRCDRPTLPGRRLCAWHTKTHQYKEDKSLQVFWDTVRGFLDLEPMYRKPRFTEAERFGMTYPDPDEVAQGKMLPRLEL